MCESICAKADHAVLNPPGQVLIPLLTLSIVFVCNPMDFVALLNMNNGIKIQAANRKDFSFVGEGLEICAAEKGTALCWGFLIYFLSTLSRLNAPRLFLWQAVV